MTSFKEFLNNKVINEENINKLFNNVKNYDKKALLNKIIIDVIEDKKISKWDKNNPNDITRKQCLKEIRTKYNNKNDEEQNDVLQDDEKLNDYIIGFFKEYEKYIEQKKIHDNGFEDSENNKSNFKKSLDLINFGMLDKDITNEIKKCFNRANNGDETITKDEFINAINNIKKLSKKFRDAAPNILHILYLKQRFKDEATIITKDGLFNGQGNNGKEDNDGNEKREKWNNILSEFKNFKINIDVLKRFDSIKHATGYLKKPIEEIKKDLEVNDKGFKAGRTEDEKDIKNVKDDIEQAKAEKEKFIEQHKQEISSTSKKMDDIRNKVTANQEIENSVEKEIMQKRQFYIFKAKMIKASNVEDSNDIDDFIETIRKNAEELMNDAKRKMELLKKEEKSTNLSEGLGDFFKKITTPKTYDDKFSKSSEDIDNIEKKANTQIENIASSIGKTLKNLFGQINSETKFNKKIKLELQFDQTVNEFGYLMTKAVQQFTRDVDSIASKLNKHKKAEDLKDVKSFTQEGNENIAITMIKRLFDKANCNITEKIVRFFLTNLILNYHDSKKIIEALNQNNFDGLGNCVFTSNNQVPIYTKYDIKQLNNNVTYYEVHGSDWIKNPATLLEKAGIKVSSLSHDVLQKSYGILKKYADENKKDVDAYKEAIITINSGIKASVMSEEDINPPIQSAAPLPTEQRLDSIAAAGGQLLKDDFKGFSLTGNQPDDIAFGQYCSVNNYIVVSNNKNKLYLFNKQSFDNLVKTLEQLKSTEQNKANINNTPTNAENVNNNSQNNSSVVTSANADSTYGNGYNKKADAIKKKLNCTTYTYSPNPKLKIVRRTFD